MRKITEQAVRAFRNNEEFKKDNTQICKGTHDSGALFFKLHNNTIAMKVGDTIKIKDAGWQTNTTKERLNGILEECGSGYSFIFQKDFQWYLNRHGDIQEFPSNEWVEI